MIPTIRKFKDFAKKFNKPESHRSLSSYHQSNSESDLNRFKRPKFENTFKMESDFEFPSCKVKEAMHTILESNFSEESSYNPLLNAISVKLCEEIKYRLKMIKELDRFKVVVQVCCGEKHGQEIKVGSRCIWDSLVDGQAVCSYENSHIYVIATAYGLYFE